MSGLAGVASGVVMALVVPAVAMDMYRYPFSPGAYTAAQIVFAVNHVGLLVGLLGAGWIGAARGPLWRAGCYSVRSGCSC